MQEATQLIRTECFYTAPRESWLVPDSHGTLGGAYQEGSEFCAESSHAIIS